MADIAAQPARVHADHAVDPAGQERDVLFGDHHRLAARRDGKQRLDDRCGDFRSEAKRGFVDQVECGFRHQRTADRDHAPFAPRECTDQRMLELSQGREDVHDEIAPASPVAPGLARMSAAVEMLRHRQAGEYRVALRRERDAEAHDGVRPAPRTGRAGSADLAFPEADGAVLPPDQRHNRAEERALAVAVQPDEADPLSFAHGEIDLVQHAQRAVAGVEAADGEDLIHARRPRSMRPSPSDRRRHPRDGPWRSPRRGRARQPGPRSPSGAPADARSG